MIRSATITVALVLGLAASTAQAAFENVDISPRARAMGGTAVAVADDAFAPFFNPAGMAGQTRPALGNSYVKPYGLSFNEQMYFGGVAPLSARLGALGFGYRRFAVTYQDVDLTTESTFTLAHGLTLYEDLHSTIRFGTALNLYDLEYAETVGGVDPGHASVVGADVGLQVVLHERTRLGVLVRNLNNPQIGLDNEELQQQLTGGISYVPYDGVVTAFEVGNSLDGQTRYRGGVEFAALGALSLRGGVATNPSLVTGGFGYGYGGITVDYGFSTGGGVLAPSHQFGMTFAWGGEAP
ncbi:MAG: hypothetical protein IPH09_05875 [bacterium]|nr:hypothetical protein [bacterium]MBK9303728.1 hypothetical protein [bacterium]